MAHSLFAAGFICLNACSALKADPRSGNLRIPRIRMGFLILVNRAPFPARCNLKRAAGSTATPV